MSKEILECPHCGQILRQSQHIEPLTGQNLYFCDTHDCYPTECVIGTESMWQAYIQSQRDLQDKKEEIEDLRHNYSVVKEQQDNGYAYAVKTIAALEKDLQIAKQALEEIAKREDSDMFFNNQSTAEDALKQINKKD